MKIFDSIYTKIALVFMCLYIFLVGISGLSKSIGGLTTPSELSIGDMAQLKKQILIIDNEEIKKKKIWVKIIEIDNEKLPRNYIFGTSYYGIKRTTLFVQEDIIITPSEHVNYRTRLGIEYKLENKLLFRCGLKQEVGALSNKSNDKLQFTPAFGLGIPINIWKRKYIQTDYSLDMGLNKEGMSHLFSFSLKL